MYGSYGSYSSMSAMSAPMDITSSNLRAHDATCAFPSWPRRSSLSDSEPDQPRATSFLSDDDLFLCDPFEDDARSVSSGSSSVTSSPGAGGIHSPRHVSDAEVLDMERERLEAQRDFVRRVVGEKEKERRRQQQQLARRQQMQPQPRRSSPGSKKSPPNKSKLSSMTPIAE